MLIQTKSLVCTLRCFLIQAYLNNHVYKLHTMKFVSVLYQKRLLVRLGLPLYFLIFYSQTRVCSNLQAIGRNFGSAMQFFVFKRQFTAQLALTSFVGYLLCVSHRNPMNIHFSWSTGNILHLSFVPGTLQQHFSSAFKTTSFIAHRTMQS